jgi:hypothetical protein
MSQAKYFIITSGEEGIDIEEVEKDDLLKQLAPADAYLASIIKGEIVVPRPVEVVKQYELP